MSVLKRVFSWLSKNPKSQIGDAGLSEEMLALLSEQKAFALKAAIRSLVKHQDDDSRKAVQKLAKAAQAAGWDESEIKKIDIYANYFTDHVSVAYEEIIRSGFCDTDFDMYVLACISLYLNDDFEDAYKLLKCRKLIDPGFDTNHDFLSFAGYIVLAAGRPMDEALEYLDVGFQKGLCSVAFVTNGYPIYFEAGRLEETAGLRMRIHEKFGETDPEVNWSVATIELARDYYPEGFRLAEWRYQHPEAGIYINRKLLEKTHWQGEDLKGKTLLVHAEQGLGDTIMCARFLPQLLEISGKVILECQEEAVTLLEEVYPEVQIVPAQKNLAAEMNFDFWVGAMSLPHRFNVTRDTVPATKGYLRVPSEHAGYWRKKVADSVPDGYLRVGVAWSGNPRHRADRRRSMSFDLIKPFIAETRNAIFFPLQTSTPKNLPSNTIDISEELVTLADTAALIGELDIVITVDTSVVHIAGALGKKTWLVFPYRYEWRWGLEGERNNWYESVRVLRQPRHGDWMSVLTDVFTKRLPALMNETGVMR